MAESSILSGPIFSVGAGLGGLIVCFLSTDVGGGQVSARIIHEVSEEYLRSVMTSSKTMSEALRKLGVRVHTEYFRLLKRRLKDLGIEWSASREFGKRRLQYGVIDLPLEALLVDDSKIAPSSLRRVKDRLIKEGVIKNVCHKCGLGPVWNGEPLTLHIDHVSGNRKDNRLENLNLLCPNCHSQTPTYCGKKNKGRHRFPNDPVDSEGKRVFQCPRCKLSRKKARASNLCLACSKETSRLVIRPGLPKLLEDIEDLGYVGTGRKYGVTDNAIRKWERSYKAEESNG